MAEEQKKKKKKKKAPRQEWNPHWSLKLIYGAWMAFYAAVKVAVGAVVTVAIIVITCGLVFAGILGRYLQEDILPGSDYNFTAITLPMTSFMYYQDSSGEIQLLQQIHTTTDRQWADYDEIPEDLIHAAVAIEDHRFFEHQGVDWFTTVKAFAGMMTGGSGAGGSTITQQLIKNLTGEDSVTVQRKVQEIFRAQVVERTNSKQTIMEWYLNTIYLGEGCGGVKSAAATYFGKELQNLTAAECASLISITNNPSLYDPYVVFKDGTTGKDENRDRQCRVLTAMYDQGWLTREEYLEAYDQELVFKRGISDEDKLAECPHEECGYVGTVGELIKSGDIYRCPNCSAQIDVELNESSGMYSWYVDTVLEDVAKAMVEKDGLEWNGSTRKIYVEKIQTGGYHIFTPFDADVQKAVDNIYTDLSQIPNTRSGQQLQSAIVVIDNNTGDIVAMSGGVGEKLYFDAFNRATDSRLQTGSSIKPLSVYAPAFEMGVISPITVIKDLPLHYDNGPFPLNDNRQYSYSRTVFSGLTSSVNAVAVNILDLMGTDYGYQFAKEKFGLTGLTDNYTTSWGEVWSDIGYAPLGLGALTEGVSVRDMASAFATFANDGTYRRGRTFTKVYDSDGNLVIDNEQESREILSHKTVNYVNYCLNNAVRNGTGTEAYFSGTEMCGKTGTTSSNKDRWFCGYNAYYTAAIWSGYDNPESIYPTSVNNPSAVLWKKVMQPLVSGKPGIDLYHSSEMRYATVCLDSGLIATEACTKDVRTQDTKRTESAYAYYDDIPTRKCDKHVLVDYCLEGNAVANEYCKKFAEVDETVKVEERALVKMTQKQIDEMLKAKNYNLRKWFLEDNYIYLVNNNGTDAKFKGIKNDKNKDIDAPYIVCTVHTKEAWEAYEAAHAPEPEPTEPVDPIGDILDFLFGGGH